MAGKLVRDRVPEIIRNAGKTPITRKLTDETEYMTELFLKLDEEVAEFKESMDTINLADILEVVYALGECYGLTHQQLDHIKDQKALARGDFSDRVYLEDVE